LQQVIKVNKEQIRNFSIIAHVDHGKSTLADRLLEITGALTEREKQDQFLDKMDLERERGITIKLQTVRLNYEAKDGKNYVLNLIDTPGHVDFSYEVSRSLSACEGAVLVIDASEGVEAQTLANVYLALENNLEVIPVINKIDLPNADVSYVKKQIKEDIGLPAEDVLAISAKQGIGIKDVLEQIVTRIPPPQGDIAKPFKALIFDSLYDKYRGVITYLRVVDGFVKKGMKIKMLATQKIFEVQEVGVFTPHEVIVDSLFAGEVGFITASIKNVKDTRVGDTVADASFENITPLPGYRKINPMVFCGIYPVNSSDFEILREALEKLELNDASLVYEPESSVALGFGFRCGFLGLLHLEIIKERIEREFKIPLISTSPSVIYEVYKTDGTLLKIGNPTLLPKEQQISCIKEPYIRATIIVPYEYIGPTMKLCQEKRGDYISTSYIDSKRVNIIYELPLAEVVYDFFDKLKSYTRGYASFDYTLSSFKESKLVKLDILLNGQVIDAFSSIVHKDKAYFRGRALVQKLKKVIPRQMFEIPIQAAIGSRVIARETIRALKKNVLAKCYGGDVTRKRKLLEKQKEGKKRMKAIGNVEIPQEAFTTILRIDDEDS